MSEAALSQYYHFGDLVGTVLDGKTLEQLPFVNIQLVELPSYGTVSDSSGSFILRHIPVGTYSVKVSLLGYQPYIQTNVVIATGRSTKMLVRLAEQPVEAGNITVQATYFSKSNELAPLSINSYDRADVKRQPGSAQDVQRVVQNLPGIASSCDNANELIVRGGAPYENLTVVDYTEIPSINHFSNEFNSAGPINMINIDLIEDVQFSAGGFPPQYGDKTSSVMDISIREGDRQKSFASNTGFNMAGFGILMEGKLHNGSGSWILSVRESFLEVVDKILGISTISLTAVPKYWDAQTKIVYDVSPSWKISLNALYGDSRIFIEGEPADSKPEKENMTDSTGIQDVSSHNKQYVVGINVKHLFGKEGYSVLTLYTIGTRYDVDVNEFFVQRSYNSSGTLTSYQKLNCRDIYHDHQDEGIYALKYDMFYKIHHHHELSLGGQVQATSHWLGSTKSNGELERYDLNNDGIFENTVQRPDVNFAIGLHAGDVFKYAAYLNDRIQLFPRLITNIGVRYDYFTYSHNGNISPRVSVAYDLIPASTIISLAAGEYCQTQPLPYYTDRQNIGYNKSLPNAKSRHLVAGIQQYIENGIKFSLEGYYKKFKNIPEYEDFIYSSDPTFWSDRMLAVGTKKSYGLEFLLQKKQVENYYGTISLSFSKTIEADPRKPPLVQSYRSQYDYPFIANIVGGKITNGWRSWLNKQPWFIKYPSMALPISNDMEISFRYRYQSGSLYTPKTFITSQQYWEGGIRWSAGRWYDSDRINSERYPAYSRFDIQWISRFYMKNWNINIYLSIMNVLNRKNIFYYEYQSDGTIETIYQYGFFPVGGVEIEF
jgi:hypothetical protein